MSAPGHARKRDDLLSAALGVLEELTEHGFCTYCDSPDDAHEDDCPYGRLAAAVETHEPTLNEALAALGYSTTPSLFGRPDERDIFDADGEHVATCSARNGWEFVHRRGPAGPNAR